MLSFNKLDLFRANSELFVDNMIRMFDPDKTGYVKFTELLLTFSMAMRGTGKISTVYSI